VLALVSMSGKIRIAFIVLDVLVLVATESRTSQIATVVAFIIYFILRRSKSADLSGSQYGSWKRILAILASVGFIALALYFVLTSTDSSFSNRGTIWTQALALIEARPLFGLGISQWVTSQSVGLLPDYFPHSLYVYLLFAGGWIAVGIFSILVIAFLKQDSPRSFSMQGRASLMAVLLVAGIGEVVWNPTSLDGLTWYILAIQAHASERPLPDPISKGA